MSMGDRSTLLRTPPDDPNKAPIENAIEVTELAVLGPVSHEFHSLNHPYAAETERANHCLPEHLHQHPPAVAAPRSPRHLWRRRHRHVHRGGAAHRGR